MTDTATFSGGSSPTGKITFNLYGPSVAANCTTAPVDTEVVSVNGNGPYTTPTGFIPSQAGTYWWTASYGGDTKNNPVASNCGAESVTIGFAPGAHLYWTDSQAGLVFEANVDGSDPQPIVSGQNGPAEGVAVNGSNLFWADTAAGTIMEANLDGSNLHPFVSGQSSPTGVAVVGQQPVLGQPGRWHDH